MTLRIGLDPGLVGACVLVRDGQIVRWARWDIDDWSFVSSRPDIFPAYPAHPLGRASQVGVALRELCSGVFGPFSLVVEGQHVQHGVRSSLALARYAGALAGPLATEASEVLTPTSREWRASVGVPIQLPRVAAKSYAVGLVRDRWGEAVAVDLGEDGCEAALMALYEPRAKRVRARKTKVVVTEPEGGEGW